MLYDRCGWIFDTIHRIFIQVVDAGGKDVASVSLLLKWLPEGSSGTKNYSRPEIYYDVISVDDGGRSVMMDVQFE
jgi:hypothetical protein